MIEAPYSIQAVARRTGLSAHVIRIWEQRYQAVEPRRTPTNRRLYAAGHIERLLLLQTVTQAGHRIGQVARLTTEQLRRLAVESGTRPEPSTTAAPTPRGAGIHPLVESCLSAITMLDARTLHDALHEGARDLGALGVLQRVVAPLAQRIGERWREGILTAAHEHFATAALRVFLGNAAAPYGSVAQAPVLVVSTPAGQVHELGALLVGAVAANLGWQVTHLGASLPAAEIAGAARQCRARAVALSLVYPEDDPRLEGELIRLRESLPEDTVLLVGGRALPPYRGLLDRLGAIPIDSLAQLGAILDGLRAPGQSRKSSKPTRPPRPGGRPNPAASR